MIAAVPHVAAMAPYALADITVPPGKRLLALCQNESLRPPSPQAAEAAARAARDQHLYPDPDWSDLRAVLADIHQIDAGQIICGNGSLDLIACLARAYLSAGDAALAPAHAYPFFRTATLATGARFDTAEERNQTADIDALLAALRPDTRIVFLANPGNPTGTRIARAEILRLRLALPEKILLVIDEAYGEFADHLGEGHFDQVEAGNTVVLRTLSKAYGLAGARVGYGLFPPSIGREIRKLLNPNNVSAVSQASAAAAVADQAYMRETCRQTAQIRDGFCSDLRAAGMSVADSFTNFAMIRFPSAAAAEAADRALRAEGIVLRAQGGVGLPTCLRATIGRPDDMRWVMEVLKNWMVQEGQS